MEFAILSFAVLLAYPIDNDEPAQLVATHDEIESERQRWDFYGKIFDRCGEQQLWLHSRRES